MKAEANILLETHLKELGFEFVPEYRFLKERKWRVDYKVITAHQDFFAVEIEGSVYANGRHTRGKGFEADCHKYNTLTTMRIPLLRFTTGQVKRGEDIPYLQCFAPMEHLCVASDGIPALLV